MSSNVPRISGNEAVKAFCKAGYFIDHIRGSHHILKHESRVGRLSIPVHAGRTVGIGLLQSQIKAAGMTVEEFSALL
jgi:predicted RNA binding protein YcfA (HicA-like mRNA interferase family)